MTSRFCAVSLLFALLFSACSPKDPANPRFVAAKVYGEKITRAQVDERVTHTLAQMNVSPDILDETIMARLRWRDLQEMIEEKLILKEGKDRKLEGIDAEAQKKLETIKSRFPSEDAFKKGLQESGLTEEKMIGQMRLSLTMQKLVEEAGRDLPPLSEAELQEAYQTNPNYSQRPEMVQIQHIFQSVPEGTSPEEKARKKAVLEAAAKRIQAGEPFESLVQELSEDANSKNNKGALPPLQKGQTPPEFEKVVFGMKANQISPVFASRHGWHLVRMTSHQKAETLTYEQAKPQIEVDLLIQKRSNTTGTVLESLRKKGKVEVFFPEPATDAGPGADAEKEDAPAPTTGS